MKWIKRRIRTAQSQVVNSSGNKAVVRIRGRAARFPPWPFHRGVQAGTPRLRHWIVAGGVALVMMLAVQFQAFAAQRVQAAQTPIGSTPRPTANASMQLPTPTPSPPPEVPDGMYRVQQGDTLLTIAVELGLDLHDAYCLVTPRFSPEQPLVIGELLARLPPDQGCHRVDSGETLAGVAAQYETTAVALRAIDWNELASDVTDIMILPPGRYLRVPVRPVADYLPDTQDAQLPMILRQSADISVDQVPSSLGALSNQGALPVGGPATSAAVSAPAPADWPYGSGHFVWPIYGWLSQDFHPNHRGIDVAAPLGTLVTAADRGRVVRAGWSELGYGNLVIIDHNIDYVTVYAHLSEVFVEPGEIVGQGAPIGRVGATGNSTGPHLHFEIRDFGQRVDPIDILMR